MINKKSWPTLATCLILLLGTYNMSYVFAISSVHISPDNKIKNARDTWLILSHVYEFHNVGRYNTLNTTMPLQADSKQCDLRTHHYTADASMVDLGYTRQDYRVDGHCRIRYVDVSASLASVPTQGADSISVNVKADHSAYGSADSGIIGQNSHHCDDPGYYKNNNFYIRVSLYCSSNQN